MNLKQLLNDLDDLITASFTPQHESTDNFGGLHEGSDQLLRLFSL
jgi:hypothetical protein